MMLSVLKKEEVKLQVSQNLLQCCQAAYLLLKKSLIPANFSFVFLLSCMCRQNVILAAVFPTFLTSTLSFKLLRMVSLF